MYSRGIDRRFRGSDQQVRSRPPNRLVLERNVPVNFPWGRDIPCPSCVPQDRGGRFEFAFDRAPSCSFGFGGAK